MVLTSAPSRSGSALMPRASRASATKLDLTTFGGYSPNHPLNVVIALGRALCRKSSRNRICHEEDVHFCSGLIFLQCHSEAQSVVSLLRPVGRLVEDEENFHVVSIPPLSVGNLELAIFPVGLIDWFADFCSG